MSKIKNGGLDQSGAGPFEQQQFGTAGVERVKLLTEANANSRHVNTASYHHLIVVCCSIHVQPTGRPPPPRLHGSHPLSLGTIAAAACLREAEEMSGARNPGDWGRHLVLAAPSSEPN